MPSPTPFTASGATETQKNTELALYLLRFIEQRRDPQERIWRGERSIRTLQATCQVLEALHELGLRGLTNHLTEPGVNWLLALPLDLPAEDLRAFRLFPTRFRTLAQLGKFDAARLMGDFEMLSRLYDEASGWIHDAPVDLHPTLVTLIWADTLLHLEAHNLLTPELRAQRDGALVAIGQAFSRWLESAQATETARNEAALASGPNGAEPSAVATTSAGLRPGDIPNAGDASYAFDVLVRAGRLRSDSPQMDAARQLFDAALRERPAGSMRRSDYLYCAIHLQYRFPQHAGTREAVQGFLTGLRARYETDECQREPLSFHALTLRLVVAHLGEALRSNLLERLWRDSLAAAEAQERQEQEAIETEFVELVRQSIHVHLTPPQRITGTRARGEVYRVRFGLTTESTDEHGSPLSTPRDTLRLIVKKGPPEVLERAIQRYRSLPEPLQRLFARHADVASERAPGYLIMQDLAEMQPLSEVISQLDRPVVLASERSRAVSEAAASVSRVMQTLHGFQRRPCIVGHQLEIVYLAPMAQALERLVQPPAFPELKQWLNGPLTINRRKYRQLDWYLAQLRRHEARLTPESLGFVHGDCHSRNLMLSRNFETAKFVDIETLSSAEDYVVDYGLLLEDIAVYQMLPYGSERGRIDWDDITTTRPNNPAHTLDNWIAYPAFPRSEAVVGFQAELMGQLGEYAASIGDTHWQARLWLAIARGLLLLASRQLTSHEVEPHRRLRGPRQVNDTRLVQVAYAEALRLLRELVEHLSVRRAAALPEMPFPGEHRPAPRTPQTAGPVTALIEALGPALGDSAERRPVPEKPFLTDYVTAPGQQLFARLHTREEAPVMYLAGRPEQFADPAGLGQPVGAEDAVLIAPGLGTRVALAPGVPLAAIIDLVRQARQWVEHAL